MKDLELALDTEQRAAEDARQAATLLERKRIALQTELDDVRAMLDAVSTLSSLLSCRRVVFAFRNLFLLNHFLTQRSVTVVETTRDDFSV